MQREQRLLNDVLGVRNGAEHPVGDRECDGTQLINLSFVISHTIDECDRRANTIGRLSELSNLGFTAPIRLARVGESG